jgi:hypothetical protein
MDLSHLKTLDEVAAARVGKPLPKPVPHQITKDTKAKQKKMNDEAFRDLIWKLDEGRSRATGKPLRKSGTTNWHELGEVDHAIQRSLAPELIYEPSNGVLLSKWENRMRKVSCIRAPEFHYFDYTGPENRREPQHFIWRNDDGTIIKETRR